MTNEELRELDAWIAVNLFDFKPIHFAERCDGENIIKCGACGRTGHANCYGNGSGAIQLKCSDAPCCEEAHPKHYTTDRAAAMEVLEKIHTVTSAITGKHECCPDGKNTEVSFCCGGRINPGEPNQFETADTLPLAICLFARKLFEK